MTLMTINVITSSIWWVKTYLSSTCLVQSFSLVSDSENRTKFHTVDGTFWRSISSVGLGTRWRTTKSTLPSLTVMARQSWRRIHLTKRGFLSREMKTQLLALTRPIVLRVTRTGSSWIWPCLSMNQLTLMSNFYKKKNTFLMYIFTLTARENNYKIKQLLKHNLCCQCCFRFVSPLKGITRSQNYPSGRRTHSWARLVAVLDTKMMTMIIRFHSISCGKSDLHHLLFWITVKWTWISCSNSFDCFRLTLWGTQCTLPSNKLNVKEDSKKKQL